MISGQKNSKLSEFKIAFAASVLSGLFMLSGTKSLDAQESDTSITYNFQKQALVLGGNPSVTFDCKELQKFLQTPEKLYADCDMVERMDPNNQEICNDPSPFPTDEKLQKQAYSAAMKKYLHHMGTTHHVCSNELLKLYNRAGITPPSNLKPTDSNVKCPIIEIRNQCKVILDLDGVN